VFLRNEVKRTGAMNAGTAAIVAMTGERMKAKIINEFYFSILLGS
jgi:hypothetical protein